MSQMEIIIIVASLVVQKTIWFLDWESHFVPKDVNMSYKKFDTSNQINILILSPTS